MSFSSLKRSDGRNFSGLRPFSAKIDLMSFSLCSLIVKTGKTSVLCSVSIQDNVPEWRLGKGWLSAEYR